MWLFLLIIAAVIIYYFVIYKDNGSKGFLVGGQKKCPNCRNPIEEEFNVCPVCKETLKRKCGNCGERLDVSWQYCPFCENPTDIGRVK